MEIEPFAGATPLANRAASAFRPRPDGQ